MENQKKKGVYVSCACVRASCGRKRIYHAMSSCGSGNVRKRRRVGSRQREGRVRELRMVDRERSAVVRVHRREDGIVENRIKKIKKQKGEN